MSTNELKNTVTYAASGLLNSVSQGVSYLASSSTGLGDAVHSIGYGVTRLITSPPDCNDIKEHDPNIPIVPCSESLSGTLLEPPESDSSGTAEFSPMRKLVHEELGINENYFKAPEVYDISPTATCEEIQSAIDKCKQLILTCEESTEERRILVHRLIQLRLCHEMIKEDQESASMGIHVLKGHRMHPVLSYVQRSTKQNCDRCTHIIWGVLHVMFKCSLCGFQCHQKCLDVIHRRCASLYFNEKPNYTYKICPERGLISQNFRCSECNILITGSHSRSVGCFRGTCGKESAWTEPQLCDYTGLYYCPACHWGRTSVVPARVVHNWDFEEYPVCQQSIQLFHYMNTKPLIYLEELNPNLFMLVEELIIVKKTREELILMKAYLCTCRSAQESRILRLLEDRQHFVEEAHCYSLQDLIDTHNGTLVPFLQDVHSQFLTHIRDKCLTCRGKGFICELCSNHNIIYPFDDEVSTCKDCLSCYHIRCFSKADCPKCQRQRARDTSQIE